MTDAPNHRFRWTDGPLTGPARTGEAIDVEVRWNPRRRTRMGVSFAQDGTVHVEVPQDVTVDEVRELLGAHARWIRHRVRRAEVEESRGFPSDYADGTVLFYRGLPVCLRTAARRSVRVEGETLHAPRRETKRRVWDWYHQEAARVLDERLAVVCKGLRWVRETPPWRHSFMRAQWGSCSASGRLSLNSHLVKVADALIDYVLVHELCHLEHLDHGDGFRALLQRTLPDWKDRRRLLNRHRELLAEPVP